MFTEKRISRFWSKVDKKGADECWMWLGFRNPAGYGTFSARKMIMAHRYSLGLKLGREIQHPMMACHTCDNPSCVNPSHLWEGTRSDNIRDAMAKGRAKMVPPDSSTHVRGVAHPAAKLNEKAVTEIRSSPLNNVDLAKKFCVSKNLIGMVRHRKIWKHIP